MGIQSWNINLDVYVTSSASQKTGIWRNSVIRYPLYSSVYDSIYDQHCTWCNKNVGCRCSCARCLTIGPTMFVCQPYGRFSKIKSHIFFYRSKVMSIVTLQIGQCGNQVGGHLFADIIDDANLKLSQVV